MSKGFAQLWRHKIESSGIMTNAEASQLFLYLKIKATHQPLQIVVGGQAITLQPGQYFVGRKQLAAELRSSEQKIRTAMKLLEKCKLINQRSTSKGTIVSLIDCEPYDDAQPTEASPSNQQ